MAPTGFRDSHGDAAAARVRSPGQRVYGRLPLAALIFLVSSIMLAPVARAQTSSVPAFAKIKPSLALVASSDGFGSAFCIRSNGSASFYLTNAHVVGDHRVVIVYRQFPSVKKMVGTVVARGDDEDHDLAIIRVSDAGIPALHLRKETPNEGDFVANAGYPITQFALARIAGELVPSVHVGTVSAVANHGAFIEFDAQTEPGNSGGPLFDPRNGDIVGVVRAKINVAADANLAIGVGRIVLPFLSDHDSAFSSSFKVSTDSTSAESPSAVVRRFYVLLNKRKYSAAYDLLSPSFQHDWPFTQWKAGYRTTIVSIADVSESTDPSNVPVTLTAKDSSPSGTVTTVFVGKWSLIQTSSGLLLDTGLFHKVQSY